MKLSEINSLVELYFKKSEEIDRKKPFLKWLKNDMPRKDNPAFNIDPERVVLGGDSAGASLSMGVALNYKEYLTGLLLYYGWFGLRDSCSSRLYGGTEDGMSEENRAFYQDAYLRSPEDLLDPKLDVLNANLRGLPFSCLIVSVVMLPLSL